MRIIWFPDGECGDYQIIYVGFDTGTHTCRHATLRVRKDGRLVERQEMRDDGELIWVEDKPRYGEGAKADSASLVRMLGMPFDDLPKDVRELEDPYQAICEILLDRRQTEFLVNAYQQSSDEGVQRYLATRILYYIDEPLVLEEFHSQLSEEEDEQSWYAANYVAKTGDRKALEILNRHYFLYPVSSVQWADTVELFGKFGYRPAIPNLIESLDAACLNLVGAAEESLGKLYPDSPREFASLKAVRDYFTKRAEGELKRKE